MKVHEYNRTFLHNEIKNFRGFFDTDLQVVSWYFVTHKAFSEDMKHINNTWFFLFQIMPNRLIKYLLWWMIKASMSKMIRFCSDVVFWHDKSPLSATKVLIDAMGYVCSESVWRLFAPDPADQPQWIHSRPTTGCRCEGWAIKDFSVLSEMSSICE